MVNHPAKRKGDTAELEAGRLLADLTGWPVRRKLGAGRADDTGDLDGVPDTTIGVKNYPAAIVRAIRETLAELPAQQANAGTTFAAGLIRRPRRRNYAPGDEWFVVMNLEQFATLLREATEPDWDPHCRQTTLSGSTTTTIGNPIPGRNHPTRRALRHATGIE